jgi:hypothetical protein
MKKVKFIERINKEFILAVPIINGRPFGEIVEQFEKLAAEKTQDSYTGYCYDYQYAPVLYDNLQDNIKLGNKDVVELMICGGCYCEGCYPLWVTITEEKDRIRWSGFYNQFKSINHIKPISNKGRHFKSINQFIKSISDKGEHFWDYSVFPAYTFKKNDYLVALEELLIIANQ